MESSGKIDPPRLDHPTYRQDIGRMTYALAGAGYQTAKIPDLDFKLDIFRAVAGLTHGDWADATFALFIMGDGGTNATAGFNKKKLGNVALTANDGAALVQLLNALGKLPSEMRTHYAPGLHDRSITSSMVNDPPGNTGFTARDLELPPLEFAARAAVAVASSQKQSLDTVHARLMTMLNGLSVCSDPHRPVLFVRRSGELTERFGDMQSPPYQRVWDWEPLQLKPGEQLAACIDVAIDPPAEIWAVTVRDPRPPSPYGETGPYCWEESWDRLVRWTVPESATVTRAVPTINFGTVVHLAGRYSLFVLIDRSQKGTIRTTIDGEFNKPVAADGLFKLLRLATKDSAALGIDCYVRRYNIVV